MPIQILKDKAGNLISRAKGAIKKAVAQKKTSKVKKMGKMVGKRVKRKKSSLPKKAAKPGDMFNKQRADYEKAMNSAQKKGGSNGVGVGY